MKVSFSGSLVTMEWPTVYGSVASAWFSVEELIDAGKQAEAHKERERIRQEEYVWDQLMCVSGAVDA